MVPDEFRVYLSGNEYIRGKVRNERMNDEIGIYMRRILGFIICFAATTVSLSAKNSLPAGLSGDNRQCTVSENDKNMNARTDNEVIITSRISIKPDHIDAFIKLAENIIAETRKEKGCLEYYFLQDPFNPTGFFFYEKYKDQESQIFHSGQDYLKDFKKQREPMLQCPPVLNIYKVVSTL